VKFQPRTGHEQYRRIRPGTECQPNQPPGVPTSTQARPLRDAAPRSGPFGSRDFGKESSDVINDWRNRVNVCKASLPMHRIVVWPCRIGYISKAERLAYLIMYMCLYNDM
jgi:hypothetical protein